MRKSMRYSGLQIDFVSASDAHVREAHSTSVLAKSNFRTSLTHILMWCTIK